MRFKTLQIPSYFSAYTAQTSAAHFHFTRTEMLCLVIKLKTNDVTDSLETASISLRIIRSTKTVRPGAVISIICLAP